ncbi:hypothetical protein QFC22_005592 [Naganishia vaughanmartiniae]|uniref:Uncharacterized protein n=1 Tax=Naganishia vaughanmartiniae TaxID=1424756 RepID=A0ACC2WV73_9TREE|nr:hypothetical protein QFC22_005592 [Naganishia vaughanmartiniae]
MPSFMKKRKRKKQQQQQLAQPTPAVTEPETAVVLAPESPLRRLLRRTSSLASGLSRRRTRDSQNEGLHASTSTTYIADGQSTGTGTAAALPVPATPPSQRQSLNSLSQNRNSRGMTPLTPSPAAAGRNTLGRVTDLDADGSGSPLRAEARDQASPGGSPLSTSKRSQTQMQTQQTQRHGRTSSDASLAHSLHNTSNRYSGSHLAIAETRPSEVVKVETIASSRPTFDNVAPISERNDNPNADSDQGHSQADSTTSLAIEQEDEPSRSYLSLQTALASSPDTDTNNPQGSQTEQIAHHGQVGSDAHAGLPATTEGTSSAGSYRGSREARLVDVWTAATASEGDLVGSSLSQPVSSSQEEQWPSSAPLRSAVPSHLSPQPSSSDTPATTRNTPLSAPALSPSLLTPPPRGSGLSQQTQPSSDMPRHKVQLAPIVLSGNVAPISHGQQHETRLPALLFGTSRRNTSTSPSREAREERASDGKDEAADFASALDDPVAPITEPINTEETRQQDTLSTVDHLQSPFLVSTSSHPVTAVSQGSETRLQDLEDKPTAQDRSSSLTADSGEGPDSGKRQEAPLHLTEVDGFGAAVTTDHVNSSSEKQELDNDSSSAGEVLDDPFVVSSPTQYTTTADPQPSEATDSQDFQLSAGQQAPARQHAMEDTGRDAAVDSSAQLDTAAREDDSSRLIDTDEQGFRTAGLAVGTDTFNQKQELNDLSKSVDVLEDPSAVTTTSMHTLAMPRDLEIAEQPSSEQMRSLALAGQETEYDPVPHDLDASLDNPNPLLSKVKPSQNLTEADVRVLPTDSVATDDGPRAEIEGEAEDEADDEASRGISQVLDSTDLPYSHQPPAVIDQPTPPTTGHEPVRTGNLDFSPAEYAAHLVFFSPRGFMTPIEEVPTPLSVQDEPTVSDPDEQYLHEAATTNLPSRTTDVDHMAREAGGTVPRLVSRYVQAGGTADDTESPDDVNMTAGPSASSKRLPFPTSTSPSSSTAFDQPLPNHETALVPAQPINGDRPLLPFVPRLFAPRLTLEFRWTDRLLPSEITLNTTTTPPVTTTGAVALRPRERRISVYDAARHASAYGASYVPRNRLTSWALGEREHA